MWWNLLCASSRYYQHLKTTLQVPDLTFLYLLLNMLNSYYFNQCAELGELRASNLDPGQSSHWMCARMPKVPQQRQRKWSTFARNRTEHGVKVWKCESRGVALFINDSVQWAQKSFKPQSFLLSWGRWAQHQPCTHNCCKGSGQETVPSRVKLASNRDL